MAFVGEFGISRKNNRVLLYESRARPGFGYSFTKKTSNRRNITTWICSGCKYVSQTIGGPLLSVKAIDEIFQDDPDLGHICDPKDFKQLKGTQTQRVVQHEIRDSNHRSKI